MSQPFYLGLNMSGTVSAGAYTAGVMDFLIEALDAWYAEREKQKAAHGDRFDEWTIPPHELQLAVLTGASGGGITAALAAAALSQKLDYVREQSPTPDPASNALFASWVSRIDLQPLLGHADLDADTSNVASLLDSTVIRDIARDALTIRQPLPNKREWVKDGLKVVLTLTNLAGTPYAVELQTDPDSARALYHADRRQFEVLWTAAPTGGETVPLHGDGSGRWNELGKAAIATSAFPLVLAPQTLDRTAGEYNQRQWQVIEPLPECAPNGLQEESKPMPPTWGLPDSAGLQTLNVDGGVTNNSPFDCARLELAALIPPNPSGHNVRDPREADRAVVSIAPLAGEVAKGLPAFPARDLKSLLLTLLGVLINQSRVQGENIKLTADPQAATRWVISPTGSAGNPEPLAGALLDAFGAFFARVFREHDYQLGRRNCQQFLRKYFGVPWDNVVMRPYALSPQATARLDQDFGFTAEDGGTRLFPLIPLMPEVQPEVTVTRNTIDPSQVENLCSAAVDRLKLVSKRLVAQSDGGFGLKLGLDAAWLLVGGKLDKALTDYASGVLKANGFVK